MTPIKRKGTYYAVWTCMRGYCDTHKTSARHWASLRTKDKREATRLCNEMAKKLDQERARLVLGLPAERVSNLTLTQFSEDYIESTKHDKAPNTVTNERRCLVTLVKVLGADCQLAQLTQEQLEYYKKIRLADIAPRSWNSELGTLRSIFGWGLRRNPPLYTTNPFTLVTRVDKGKPTIEKYASPEDVKRVILSCKDPVWRDIIMFIYATACRGSEIRELTWKDVDMSMGVITFPYPKERRKKSIGITPIIRTVLNNAKARQVGDLVFPAADGTMLTPTMLHHRIYDIGQAIGVKLSPHMLRHSMITYALKSGVNPFAVQKQAGHAHISTTMHYTHVQLDEQKSAMEKVELGWYLDGADTEHKAS